MSAYDPKRTFDLSGSLKKVAAASARLAKMMWLGAGNASTALASAALDDNKVRATRADLLSFIIRGMAWGV
jgi:2-methylcitrate dehydratase PrpD